MNSALCLLPPILTILLAFVLKNTYIALLVGVYSTVVILSGGSFIGSILPTIDSLFGPFSDTGNVRIFMDLILISGLISVIEKSGGIAGFIDFVSVRNKLVRSKCGATILTWLVGVAVFFSDNLSCLITGAVTKDINRTFKVSYEKMAYIVHSTSTAVCLLIPFGGWGAFCAGLLSAGGVENSMSVLIKSIPLNFFCLIVVFSIPLIALTGKDFGPMKKAELKAENDPDYYKNASSLDDAADDTAKKSGAHNILLPIGVLIALIVVGMFITGKGSFFNGDGSSALLYANVFTAIFTIALYVRQKLMSLHDAMEYFIAGAGRMLPMVLLLMLAFTFSGQLKLLGTAAYISERLLASVPSSFFVVMTFILAMVLSFSTGTSMGTMSIMIPLLIPSAISLGTSVPLVAGAIWGGAVFGDQSSPISDTTLLTCSTLGCNPIDHTKTQLPYTLTAAAIATALYFICGLVM